MLVLLPIVLDLVELHGLDGQLIELNPAAIITVRVPRVRDHFGPGIRCLVHTTDGKFIAVTESCMDVLRALGRR